MWIERAAEVIEPVDWNINSLWEFSECMFRLNETFWSLDWKQAFVATKLIESSCMREEKSKNMVLDFDKKNFENQSIG